MALDSSWACSVCVCVCVDVVGNAWQAARVRGSVSVAARWHMSLRGATSVTEGCQHVPALREMCVLSGTLHGISVLNHCLFSLVGRAPAQ